MTQGEAEWFLAASVPHAKEANILLRAPGMERGYGVVLRFWDDPGTEVQVDDIEKARELVAQWEGKTEPKGSASEAGQADRVQRTP